MEHRGFISGIDIIVVPAEPRCTAFIGPENRQGEIQVFAVEERLQSGLLSAATRRVEVEASYVVEGNINRLTRLRFLDR